MYLKDLCIRNVGPVVSFDVQPQFNVNGDPKPLLFVGANGSGKTILLSSIADALIEMASPIFTDLAKSEGIARPWFRVCGSTNQRTGTPYSVTLLKLASNGSTAQYIERTGKLELDVENELKERFPAIAGQSTSTEPFHKNVSGFANDLAEQLFLQNAYCFFPASRRESPHWQNVEAFPDVDSFDSLSRFKGRLGKHVVVTKSAIKTSNGSLTLYSTHVLMCASRVDNFRLFSRDNCLTTICSLGKLETISKPYCRRSYKIQTQNSPSATADKDHACKWT